METIFTRIVSGEIPSTKIRENDEFLAILDLFPNCKGQTLVITKTRYPSDLTLMPSDVYTRYMLAVQQVCALLKTWLHVPRVGIIVEGTEIDHAHVKLYPMHWLDTTIETASRPDQQFFSTYPGYMTSIGSKMMSQEERDAIASEILSDK